MRLGVNVDHVATLRQQRLGDTPDPLIFALSALDSGADSIVCHLREDRRHIQENDLLRFSSVIPYLNLEIALSEETLRLIRQFSPQRITIVPEKREELTTESGLNLIHISEEQKKILYDCRAQIESVSLFLDPEIEILKYAVEVCGISMIELNTAAYSEAIHPEVRHMELQRLSLAAQYLYEKQCVVVAGHGLHLGHAEEVMALPIKEVNIGFHLVAYALEVGWSQAVQSFRRAFAR